MSLPELSVYLVRVYLMFIITLINLTFCFLLLLLEKEDPTVPLIMKL